MLFALGAAASSALEALQSLTASKPSSQPAGGFSQDAASLFDVSGSSAASAGSAAASGGSGFSQISPATMSALLAAQSQSSTGPTAQTPAGRSQALQDLFSQIDANGDGQLSKTEFENALGAGSTNIAQADDVFSKLDKDGDGSVSLGELSSAFKGAGHGHHAGGSSGSNSTDPLAQVLQGSTSTSATNSDGSTTTSLTLPDGSKVTMTSPAATTAASAATASYNSIEQMIRREASAISFSAVPALSLNA